MNEGQSTLPSLSDVKNMVSSQDKSKGASKQRQDEVRPNRASGAASQKSDKTSGNKGSLQEDSTEPKRVSNVLNQSRKPLKQKSGPKKQRLKQS